MDLRTCQLDDLALYGRSPGHARRIGRGAFVDLDDEIEPGLTVRAVLGPLATTQNFAPVDDPDVIAPLPLPTDPLLDPETPIDAHR